ncbi:hypothetical protein M8C21_019872, partial [Ambrosia artemisiifolia]
MKYERYTFCGREHRVFDFGLEDDTWRWEADGSGIFSVRSVRGLTKRKYFANRGQDPVWNNWAPIKVNFLVWRLIQDRLPTAIAVWEFVTKWCRLRPLFILAEGRRGRLKEVEEAVFMVIQTTLWLVWKWRNEIIFNGKRVNICRLKEEIKSLTFLWVKNSGNVGDDVLALGGCTQKS